jgi:heptosyltransferase-2
VVGQSHALPGGAKHRQPHTELVAALSERRDHVVNLAGRLTVPEYAALAARAGVVLSNDSGPLHVAAAAGASTVALFGPETPVLYGPLRIHPGQRHEVHYRRLACSPCIFVHDDKELSCWFAEAKCMTAIDPEVVLRSVRALLAERASAVAQSGDIRRR